MSTKLVHFEKIDHNRQTIENYLQNLSKVESTTQISNLIKDVEQKMSQSPF